jgi:hypothetical protein
MVEKIYNYPRSIVINTVHDIVELQKGKPVFTDTANGKIFYRVTLYAYKYEFRFTVTSTGKDSSLVTIETSGTALGANDTLRRQIALLDSMLGDVEKTTKDVR